MDGRTGPKERNAKPILIRRNPMSQVTYRGVSYDTDKRRQAQAQEARPHVETLIFRGHKYQKEVR